MTQPAVPGSADWQRRWTIDAGSVTLRPVTRRLALDVLDGGPITDFHLTGPLPGTDEVRYTRNLSPPVR